MERIRQIVLAVFLTTTGVGLAACGGDDSASPGTSDDGGVDGNVPTTDGGGGNDGTVATDSAAHDSATTDTGGGTDGGGTDSADAGCNFATYVIGLITNQTTDQAIPTTNLGESCVDNQDQTEFHTLFP